MTINTYLPDIMGLEYPKEPDMNNTHTNVEPTREMPAIDRALREQNDQIESLVDVISALLEKVNPFLTPEDEATDEAIAQAQPRKPASKFASILNDNTDRLAYQVRRLNEIRHRVEL